VKGGGDALTVGLEEGKGKREGTHCKGIAGGKKGGEGRGDFTLVKGTGPVLEEGEGGEEGKGSRMFSLIFWLLSRRGGKRGGERVRGLFLSKGGKPRGRENREKRCLGGGEKVCILSHRKGKREGGRGGVAFHTGKEHHNFEKGKENEFR